MAQQDNYYGMNYPPPPSDYQSSGPVPQGPAAAVHAGVGDNSLPKHHKHHDSGYDRYGGANQYPPQEHGAYSQYPPSSAYPSQPPPQNYAQDPYAQAQEPGLEPPYSRETRHSPAPGYETAVAPYQPPEPEWDDQPQYQYPPQGAGPHGYPPPGYGGHPPPLSSGYDDGYDSHEERRRQKHRHRGSDSGSRHSRYGDDDKESKEKKKKGLSEKEKGLGASLLGGAGGAFVGHEMGGGALGTILGIGAGAIGAALIEKDHDKQRKKDKDREREKKLRYRDDFEYGSSHVGSGSRSPPPAGVPPVTKEMYEDERYKSHDMRHKHGKYRSRSSGRGGNEDDSSTDSELKSSSAGYIKECELIPCSYQVVDEVADILSAASNHITMDSWDLKLLFEPQDQESEHDGSLKPNAIWTDVIFHRLGTFLSRRSSDDQTGDEDDNPAKRQYFYFILGLGALYAFLQSNVTGPPLRHYTKSQLALPQDRKQIFSAQETLVQSLGEDGIAAYKLIGDVELLCLAEAIFTCPPILKNIESARWAKLRVEFLHQRLLSEVSPTLQNSIYSDLALLDEQILASEPDNVAKTVKIEYLLEKATIHTHHGLEKLAREDLEAARRERNFEYALTGRLGKRTKYQEKDLSQLVVLALSPEDNKHGSMAADSNMNGDSLPTSNTSTNGDKNGDSRGSTGPQTLDLNDDTLLESISFKEGNAAPGIVEESNLPPSLASLDPSAQPKLNPIDSNLLLSLASSITNTTPVDGLTREETLPYAVRALEGGSSNWQVYTQALLVRSRIEGYKSRTMERGLLQLQALVDQVIAETASREDEQIQRTQASDMTTFLPRPKETENAQASERLRYIFQLCTPFRWELEAELAAKWVSLGGLKTALEIYTRLEMWAEAALCWAATEKEDKAKKIVRRQLFHASNGGDSASGGEDEEKALDAEEWTGPARDPPPADAPRLYCILGDIDRNPEMYEKAWEVSNQRYARAQRSLGKLYFAAKDYAKAALAYNKSLKVNQLNHAAWFALGCALLQLDQFDRAADAFTRTVQLDDTDAEAWANLATALLHKGKTPRRESDDSTPEDNEASTTAPSDPQRHKLDALRALQRAAALKYDSPLIWENLLTISASLDPPSYPDIIRSLSRILTLRGASLGESAIDASILDLLITHTIQSSASPVYDPSQPGPARLVVELVDTKVVPLITTSR
ncbi:MAG: hypothetical protein Q9157_008835, partial [Trypethelium eluteriae]